MPTNSEKAVGIREKKESRLPSDRTEMHRDPGASGARHWEIAYRKEARRVEFHGRIPNKNDFLKNAPLPLGTLPKFKLT